MSGVYIKGMEMPTDRSRWVVIYPDGKVEYSDKTDEWETLDKGAVHVPEHGRMIDAAALWVEINKICDRRDEGIISDLTCLQQLLSAVRHAPTIIPAEPCNNLSKPCKEEL